MPEPEPDATGWYWVVAADGVARTAHYDAGNDTWTVTGGHAPLRGRFGMIVISARMDRPPWMIPPVRRQYRS
jgi:hypothetical protein